MDENTVKLDDNGYIRYTENGEYQSKTLKDPVMIGKPFMGIHEIKKNGIYIHDWNALRVTIDTSSQALIEESMIDVLSVRGLCVLRRCKINHLDASMFGNVFICEDCDIDTLSISGTVHTISSASSVNQIELHRGGRIRLGTIHYQLGKPPQPKNLRLDGDRDWCYGILSITKHNDYDEAEYWAFG